MDRRQNTEYIILYIFQLDDFLARLLILRSIHNRYIEIVLLYSFFFFFFYKSGQYEHLLTRGRPFETITLNQNGVTTY